MDCVTTFEQKSIAITTTTNVTIAVDLKVFFKKRILWFSNKGVNRETQVVGAYIDRKKISKQNQA